MFTSKCLLTNANEPFDEHVTGRQGNHVREPAVDAELANECMERHHQRISWLTIGRALGFSDLVRESSSMATIGS